MYPAFCPVLRHHLVPALPPLSPLGRIGSRALSARVLYPSVDYLFSVCEMKTWLSMNAKVPGRLRSEHTSEPGPTRNIYSSTSCPYAIKPRHADSGADAQFTSVVVRRFDSLVVRIAASLHQLCTTIWYTTCSTQDESRAWHGDMLGHRAYQECMALLRRPVKDQLHEIFAPGSDRPDIVRRKGSTWPHWKFSSSCSALLNSSRLTESSTTVGY